MSISTKSSSTLPSKKGRLAKGDKLRPQVLRLDSYAQEQPLAAADRVLWGKKSTGVSLISVWQTLQTTFSHYSTRNGPAGSSKFRNGVAADSASSSIASIQLSQADVGPRLDAYLDPCPRCEIEHCCLLSDLANMAYSVQNVTAARVANSQGLVLVTTSQACASPLPSASAVRAGRTDLPKASIAGAKSSHAHRQTAIASNIVPLSRNPSMKRTAARRNEEDSVSALFEETLKSIYDITSTMEEELGAIAEEEHAASQPSTHVTPEFVSPSCSAKPPSAWFVADDCTTKCRHFIVQGSTSLEHWQINFQFEPMTFEDPSLGVRIHRGVYEAALKLYDDFYPLVVEHVASDPLATVSFSGHSLGGSLASVLMLLFVSRGVLPATAVAPVYTFGAPAVFCQGGNHNSSKSRCKHCELECECSGRMHDSQPRGLLQSLGLTDDHVVNVIMHNDIVPRAFVCDYTSVAHILQSWWPSFKEHSGLERHHQHKVLYTFVGRIAILQPDPVLPFVLGDGHHSMLPDGPALYRMQDPNSSCKSNNSSNLVSMSLDEEPVQATFKSPSSLREAFLLFMNTPHPLTMLSTAAAYGAQGSVSRYHNPDNYTKGLEALLKTPGHS